MAQLSSIQTQYQKALRNFLLTKYTPAANACVKVIQTLPQVDIADGKDATQHDIQELETLRFAAWTLYLNIATTLLLQEKPTRHTCKMLALPSLAIEDAEQFVLHVWRMLVDGYGGSAGDVDPRLVCACLSMTLKLNVPNVGRQVAEEWYASLSDATMDYLVSLSTQDDAETNQVYGACMDAIDLYVTRVLPATNDFESAKSFVEYNPLINDEKKESLQSVLREQEAERQRSKQKKLAQQKMAEELARLAEEQEKQNKARAEALAAEEEAKRAQVTGQPTTKRANETQNDTATPSTRTPSKQSSPSSSVSSLDVPSSRAVVPQPSSSRGTRQSFSLDNQVAVIKGWIQRTTLTGSAVYIAIMFALFAILSSLRGNRGQWSQPLRTIITKLWQTIQMGTKVTYL